MKNKKLITLVIVFLFLLPTYALGSNQQKGLPSAGITPDSPLYIVDKLAESIQVALSFDKIKKADLLDLIARERLAESHAMMDKENPELAKEAIDNYKSTLDKVSETIGLAIEDGKDVTKVLDKVSSSIDKDSEALGKIISKLSESSKKGLEEMIKNTTDMIKTFKEANDLVTDKIKNRNGENAGNGGQADEDPFKKQIAKETIMKIVEDELDSSSQKIDEIWNKITTARLSYRQILALVALSHEYGKTLSEVLDSFLDNNSGIGATIKALNQKYNLNLDVKSALKAVNGTFKAADRYIQEQLKNEPTVNTPEDKNIGQGNDTSSTGAKEKTPKKTDTPNGRQDKEKSEKK